VPAAPNPIGADVNVNADGGVHVQVHVDVNVVRG
jgi:hypothetical protein